jgi:hypothetical protein
MKATTTTTKNKNNNNNNNFNNCNNDREADNNSMHCKYFLFSKCSVTLHSCELQGNGLQQEKKVTLIYSLVLVWRTVSH